MARWNDVQWRVCSGGDAWRRDVHCTQWQEIRRRVARQSIPWLRRTHRDRPVAVRRPLSPPQASWSWTQNMARQEHVRRGVGTRAVPWPRYNSLSSRAVGTVVVGRWTAVDGTVYEGAWEHGVRHGLGKGAWTNGLMYDGLWTHNHRVHVPTCVVVSRLGQDGVTPDPSPLVFREVVPAVLGDEVAGDAIPPASAPIPPAKILPQFHVACCRSGTDASLWMLEENHQGPRGSIEDGATADTATIVVVEESGHGIRVSLFQGRSPADIAREATMAALADAEAKEKRKKSAAVEAVAPATDATPPLLTTLVDPATQINVVEWVVYTSHGIATIPSLQLPVEAAPGDYFLQFDSTMDTAIPSAYFGFTIVRGDDSGSDKVGGKKDVPKKK
ncbi:hypothetical protein, variant [Aphanomyces invadans]|uniref:MORN repeat-containing protein 5 n=1 Tax=Aphanomyces invadans TaxID=157072 RepID=A0A024TZ93_9STRA|nr:hypothetical protein, variant [Aphanomyces invadans]ETV99328.1 hypothetical protein, variant [Aphanomyces invadans]|eukprot:XP_008871884.1 hypothetical protein, variant [Aphanomyces invadans]